MNSAKLPVLIIVLIGIFHLGAGQTIQHLVFGGSNYTFHAPSVQWPTWRKSRLACNKTGGDLVSIESLEEWKFLNNAIQTMTTGEYFIGLKKDGKSGEWRWISDNSKVNTTKGTFPWAKDEPNGDGNCAVMYKQYRQDYGEYNDFSCTGVKTIGYICESPTQSNGKDEGRKRCSCYTFDNGTDPQGSTWPQAKGSCKYNKKHLVVIETEREWEFITEVIQTRKGAISDEWLIGLLRSLKTGKWTWINGKPLTIDKWETKKHENNDHYALIAKEGPDGRKGSFNSITGAISRGWICEEETDNCQLGCFSHNYSVSTNSTPAEGTTPSTRIQRETSANVSDSPTTSVPGVSGQEGDNDNSSTVVIVAACLAAVLLVVLIVLAVVLLLRRKKRRGHGKDAETPQKKSSHQRAQLGENHYEPVDPVEAAKLLGTPDSSTARPVTKKKEDEYESPSANCEYAMVNKANKKRKEGDLVYAQLAEFDGDHNDTNAQKPASYEPTVYADVDVVPPEVFSRTDPDSTQPTYANVQTTGV